MRGNVRMTFPAFARHGQPPIGQPPYVGNLRDTTAMRTTPVCRGEGLCQQKYAGCPRSTPVWGNDINFVT